MRSRVQSRVVLESHLLTQPSDDRRVVILRCAATAVCWWELRTMPALVLSNAVARLGPLLALSFWNSAQTRPKKSASKRSTAIPSPSLPSAAPPNAATGQTITPDGGSSNAVAAPSPALVRKSNRVASAVSLFMM